jgi:hypothetical protein
MIGSAPGIEIGDGAAGLAVIIDRGKNGIAMVGSLINPER